MKKIVLMYNPKSGKTDFTEHLDDMIRRIQAAGGQAMPYRMEDPEHMAEFMAAIASELASDSEAYERILVSGGDGSVHHVAVEMLRRGIELPLGILPTGTANDFARHYALPQDSAEMAEVALGNHFTHCDVGKINDTYFINVASFGNLVDLSQRVDDGAKSILGVLAYYLKGIQEIPKLKPIAVTVDVDGRSFSEEIFFMLVLNGSSAGGFHQIAPYSKADDGALDVIIFKKCPLVELMPLALNVLSGKHPETPHVLYLQGKRICIRAEETLNSDVDGEAGPRLPLDIEVIQGALRLATPTGGGA